MKGAVVLIITALILAYSGAALKIAIEGGHYWVLPAFLAGTIALGYAVGDDRDREHMRSVFNWLLRRK